MEDEDGDRCKCIDDGRDDSDGGCASRNDGDGDDDNDGDLNGEKDDDGCRRLSVWLVYCG